MALQLAFEVQTSTGKPPSVYKVVYSKLGSSIRPRAVSMDTAACALEVLGPKPETQVQGLPVVDADSTKGAKD